jgi:ADP-heptose:LPS heptosyltransferase
MDDQIATDNTVMKSKVFRIASWGGLGDALLSTPTFRALKCKYNECKIIVLGPKSHAEIFKHNPYIDQVIVTSFSANPLTFLGVLYNKNKFKMCPYGRFMPIQFFNKNATRIIAETFDVQLEDPRIQVFLTTKEEAAARKELSKYTNPIILHISSIASKNQEWPASNWEQLVEQMPGYTFIQLGTSGEQKIANAVDMRGKTSFREGLALLKNAQSFVGVVSSFSHATNAFGTPGVVLFGASTPIVWGHDNNINLYKNLACAPCIQVLGNSKCPYDSECMQLISIDEVKNSLISQLSKKHNLAPSIPSNNGRSNI